MANSRFEYVKNFETYSTAMLNTYIVVRVDGKGFTKFTEAHKYEKPNDLRGLNLMNQCAIKVMETFVDIWIAIGESDEYSFVFSKDTQIYNRRTDKIVSLIGSCFSSAFVFYFPKFFPGEELKDVPLFDSRLVCYPSEQNLKDYLSWRQADTHINNLYNTCFWCIVLKDGKKQEEAHKILKGTFSDAKNEMLFQKYDINYSKIEPIYRKGSIILRLPLNFFDVKIEEGASNESNLNSDNGEKPIEEVQQKQESELAAVLEDVVEESKKEGEINKLAKKKGKSKTKAKDLKLFIVHEDLIRKDFWDKYKDYVLL